MHHCNTTVIIHCDDGTSISYESSSEREGWRTSTTSAAAADDRLHTLLQRNGHSLVGTTSSADFNAGHRRRTEADPSDQSRRAVVHSWSASHLSSAAFSANWTCASSLAINACC